MQTLATSPEHRSPPTGLPYRQLSRLNTELFLSFNETSLALLPNRFAEAVVFAVVARTCAPDWVRGRDILPPETPNRSITVNAIATSLSRSVETTRRHVAWLVDGDLLVRTSAGVALSPRSANTARIVDWYQSYHDVLLRLIADIHDTCDVDLSPGTTGRADTTDVLARSLDIALVPLDTDRTLLDDIVGVLVWGTISGANIRHVTYDPVLSRRYAVDSSPDELRWPVSLHSIAATLGMPYATVWRKAQALEAANLLARRDGGWVVLTANLRTDRVEDSVISTAHYVMRKVRELVRLGVDPAAPGYLVGRPSLSMLKTMSRSAAKHPPR